MIKFHCPHCDQKISTETESAGAAIQCPTCGEEIMVPAAPDESLQEDVVTDVHEENRPVENADAPSDSPSQPDQAGTGHSFADRIKTGTKEGWAGIKRHSKQAALIAQAEKLRNVDLRRAIHSLGKKCFESGLLADAFAEQFQAIRDLDASIAEKREKGETVADETRMTTLKRIGKDAAKASHAQALTLKREHLITELGRLAYARTSEANVDGLRVELHSIADIEARIHSKEEEASELRKSCTSDGTESTARMLSLGELHPSSSEQKRAFASVVPLLICCLFFGWIFGLPFSGRYFAYGVTFTGVLAVALLALPSLSLTIVAFGTFLRPRRLEWHKALGILAFTMVVGIFLLLKYHDVAAASQDLSVRSYGKANAIVYSTKLIGWLTQHTESPNILLRLLAHTVAVGLCEEAVKLLPLFLLILISRKRKDNPSLKPFLWLGFFSGLGFGIGEAIFTYSPWGTQPTLSLETNIIRWFACVPLHAIYTVIDAAFLWLLIPSIKRVKSLGESAVILVAASLAIAVVHGAYNTFQSFHWSIGVFLDAFAIVLMVAIIRFCSQKDAGEYDGSAESMPVFILPRWLMRRGGTGPSFGRAYAAIAAMILATLVFTSGSPDFVPSRSVFSGMGVELDQESAIVYAMGYSIGSKANPGTTPGDLETIAHQAFEKNPEANPALADVMIAGLMDGFGNHPNRLEGIDFDSLPAPKDNRPRDLSFYCSIGDLNKVKELATAENVNIKGEVGFPLHLACENGYASIAKLLLSLGAKADRPDPYGLYPIHHAVKKGELELVKLLVSSGARADEPTDPPVADQIRIESSSIFGVPSHDNAQPIHYAANAGNIPILKFLLASGANLDARDAYGNTPLHSAAGWKVNINLRVLMGEEGVKQGRLMLQKRNKVCQFILEQGASKTAKNEEGRTPLDVATDVWDTGEEHLELIKMLGGDSSKVELIRAAVGSNEGNIRIDGVYLLRRERSTCCLRFYKDRTVKFAEFDGAPSPSSIQESLKSMPDKWQSGYFTLRGKDYSQLKLDLRIRAFNFDNSSGLAKSDAVEFSSTMPSWISSDVRGDAGSFKFHPN